MRILILNWRDIKHPLAGGAEKMLYEMAKKWITQGNSVTWFCSNFKVQHGDLTQNVKFQSPNVKSMSKSKIQMKNEEVLDGIRVVRRGNSYTVHLHAFFYYWKNLRGKFDVVIDNFHFIPFFTPLYVKEKKIALICEVAQEVWDYMAPVPFLGKIGRFFEKTLMFRPYKNIPFLTISSSTKSDLAKYGISKENINVIPMGLSLPQKLPAVEKEKTPTLIFVGRLAKTKGVEDAIRAIAAINNQQLTIRLWIIGRGEPNYFKQLKELIRNLELNSNVEFLGFVSEKEKFEKMARAHIILVPSVREGWGLIVPEAGAVGTPAVVYNSPGLCDVVKDELTGLICQENTPDDLAKNALKLLQNKDLYEKIRENATKVSRAMTWDKTAKFVYDYMNA